MVSIYWIDPPLGESISCSRGEASKLISKDSRKHHKEGGNVQVFSSDPRVVAVVDDGADIVELVSVSLKKAGFTVRGFPDASSFLQYIKSHLPDLLILDLMLPDMDGLEVCRLLRSARRTQAMPIIMLTAKAEETDRVVGLELGADDYIVKPFSPRELTARVKAVLRRYVQSGTDGVIEIDGILEIEPASYQVKAHGIPVDLTPTEFRILTLLARNRGRVFTRDEILDYLWGDEKAVIDRTVDVHIRHLRQKLGKASNLIRNIRGAGYKMEK